MKCPRLLQWKFRRSSQHCQQDCAEHGPLLAARGVIETTGGELRAEAGGQEHRPFEGYERTEAAMKLAVAACVRGEGERKEGGGGGEACDSSHQTLVPLLVRHERRCIYCRACPPPPCLASSHGFWVQNANTRGTLSGIGGGQRAKKQGARRQRHGKASRV